MTSTHTALNPYDYEFDHMAMTVGKGNLTSVHALLKHFFGFKVNYNPGIIGDEDTGMMTVDMVCGRVQIALMEGVDGRDAHGHVVDSQISLYEDGNRHGPMTVQHFAIGCNDVVGFAREKYSQGIRFLTEDDNGEPAPLIDAKREVLQVFTYPVINGFFFEFKQKIKPEEADEFEEFRDDNVRGLWAAVRAKIEEMGPDGFFRLNIFGETCSLEESLQSRHVPIDYSLCTKAA